MFTVEAVVITKYCGIKLVSAVIPIPVLTQGSSLEHFKAEFTDKATKQVKVWFSNNKVLHPQININVSEFMIHLHTVWMFTMLEEILMHRISVGEMPRIVKECMEFEINGWKHILQL